MRAAERGLLAALAYAALSGLFLMVQVMLAGLLILFFSFISIPFCVDYPCPDSLILDSAAFTFLSVFTAISQYYLAALLQHSHKSRALTLSTVLVALFITVFLFAPLAARTRFAAYWMAWLPLAASFLLGALPAVFQKESDNPWRNYRTDIFRF